MAKYELSPVKIQNDLDLDIIDATLPWLSGFVCDICNKTFPTEARVNQHKQLWHTRFLCERCGKLYSSSGGLKRHLFTHTRLESTHPWTCEFCFKRFKLQKALESHLQNFQTLCKILDNYIIEIPK